MDLLIQYHQYHLLDPFLVDLCIQSHLSSLYHLLDLFLMDLYNLYIL